MTVRYKNDGLKINYWLTRVAVAMDTCNSGEQSGLF